MRASEEAEEPVCTPFRLQPPGRWQTLEMRRVVALAVLLPAGCGGVINPTCTVGGQPCPIPGQRCVYNTFLGRRICSCEGVGYRAGENCLASCPFVDTSKLDRFIQGTVATRCSGPACSAPCNYPIGECDYATGLCRCPEGVLGANCTGQCQNDCSGHGACTMDHTGAGKCVCDTGYRSVNQTDCRLACPGVPSARECHGHGACTADAKCICKPGYLGDDCSQECPGGGHDACSGHGMCKDASTCICEWGYTGAACQIKCPQLHGFPCGCTSEGGEGCRGKCQQDGTCLCNSSYAGPDCSMECLGGLGTPCSGRGTCNIMGKCDCLKGYTGPICEVACPGGVSNECSGHGRCELSTLNTSRCVCESSLSGFIREYHGEMCEVAVYNIETRISSLNRPPQANASNSSAGLGSQPVAGFAGMALALAIVVLTCAASTPMVLYRYRQVILMSRVLDDIDDDHVHHGKHHNHHHHHHSSAPHHSGSHMHHEHSLPGEDAQTKGASTKAS